MCAIPSGSIIHCSIYSNIVNLLVAGGLSETLNERGADVRRKLACADGVEALTEGGFLDTQPTLVE